MSGNVCRDCRYFNGFDGVGELWICCELHGDFRVRTTSCNNFEKRITTLDLLRRIRELEKELEQLQKELSDK